MTTYRIVPERSRVWIEATSTVHPINTETDGLEGDLVLDVTEDGRVLLEPTPRGRLSFPVDRLRSGNRLEDRELRRRIDAKRHPSIEGELVDLVPTKDPSRYEVVGDVTFRGVTRRVTGEMEMSVVGDAISLRGASEFDVRDFEMEPPRILVMRVHPEVLVRVEIVAQRAG